MKYAGVITAAGLSSRMKDFKPLMLIGEETMLESIVKNFRMIGAEEIVAVGGYKAELLKRMRIYSASPLPKTRIMQRPGCSSLFV